MGVCGSNVANEVRHAKDGLLAARHSRRFVRTRMAMGWLAAPHRPAFDSGSGAGAAARMVLVLMVAVVPSGCVSVVVVVQSIMSEGVSG